MIQQIEAVAAVVPDDFVMDIDFNMTLQNAANALPLLKKLEAHPIVGMIESPVPQEDIAANQQIRASQSKPVAM